MAHTLLTIIYHVLKDGTYYEEHGAAHFDQVDPEKLARFHARRLAELGYEVSLQPKTAA